MKIAAVVPVGDISLFGYDNVFDVCLQSITEFADEAFIVNTLSDDGLYDYRQINKSVQIATDNLSDCDVVIYLASNYYIPASSFDGLRKRCEAVKTWDYFYRGNQLADKVTQATRRIPMIIRTGTGCRCKFVNDGIDTPDGFIGSDRGDYSEYNGEMVIDVPLELTLDNLRDKMNFFRCYADILPKRNPVFDWNYYHPYYLSKMQDWNVIDYPLDHYGQEIADRSRPEYLSHLFASELWK